MRTPAAVLVAASLTALPILATHAALPRPAAPATAQAEDERAKEILRQAAEHLAGMDAYTFEFTAGRTSTAEGMFSEYYSTYAAAIDRAAGRRALVSQRGMPSVTRVSNDKEMATCLPAPSIYTLASPAKTSDEFLRIEDAEYASYLTDALRTPGLRTATADDPAAVTEPLLEHAAYAGLEDLDGRSAHRLTVDMGDQTIDIWVAAEGDPLILRAQMPLPSDIAPDAAGFWKDYKVVSWTRFADWKPQDAIPAERFAFNPPEGATKVDDLDSGFMAAMGMDWDDADWEAEEEPAPDLVGRPAPTFALELLGGGTFDLAEAIKQEKVIVLDFWATWCPPCRAGLPILAEVTGEYDPDKVAFYAINLREAGPTIEKFLNSTKLDLTVPLDLDGKVAEQYGVTGIPQTVLIGKDGSVQAIHVGLLPNLREQLKEEIDALLEGKPLADARPPAPVPADAADAPLLEEAWSARGRWDGVAAGPDGRLIAAGADGSVGFFTPDGERVDQARARADGATLRLARLREGDQPQLLLFGTWSQHVTAFDASGARLWSYGDKSGIDDVWAADLTGDGLDEVIVGFNGGAGLHALTPDGEVLWKYKNIGNVWHVTAADLDADGVNEVITTSAMGQVHVFKADGTLVTSHQAGLYANMVRVAPATDDRPAAILAGGSANRGEAVACLDPSGKRLWTVTLAKDAHISSMSTAPNRPWAAVGTRDAVYVLDIEQGKLIGRAGTRGRSTEVAWLTDSEGGDPLLAVGTGSGLVAFRVPAPNQ